MKKSKVINHSLALGADECPPARFAADGHEAAPAADTVPSNTVSDKYNPNYFMPLRWGIDSLYLSFSGQLHQQQEKQLESLKLLAQSDRLSEQSKAQLNIQAHIFEVKDKGAGMFPFVLDDNCFRIQLSRNRASSIPVAYVKISSEYLTHKPIDAIMDDLNQVLYALGSVESNPKVSRVDLFCDFASPENMESWGRDAWVTRAANVDQHAVKGKFSGWSIGLGAVMSARLYNKLLEILTSHKEYLIPLWNAAGWDGVTPIWRLEFEIKRDVLVQLGLQELRSTLANLNGLWSYASTEWLRLSLPSTNDINRSRWPLHPLWGYLSSIDFDTQGGELTRNFSPARVPEKNRILRMAFASLTSYMATEKLTEFDAGVRAYISELTHYINNHAMNMGAGFEELVNERVGIKAKRYNTILNANTQPDECTARDYLAASDGDDWHEEF